MILLKNWAIYIYIYIINSQLLALLSMLREPDLLTTLFFPNVELELILIKKNNNKKPFHPPPPCKTNKKTSTNHSFPFSTKYWVKKMTKTVSFAFSLYPSAAPRNNYYLSPQNLSYPRKLCFSWTKKKECRS